MELRNRLANAVGVRLPAALIFDHPTPEALTRDLLRRIDAVVPATVAPPPVFTDLSRLEASIDALASESGSASALPPELAVQLRRLLARVESPVAGPGDDPERAIETASNDELFDLIDRELGIS